MYGHLRLTSVLRVATHSQSLVQPPNVLIRDTGDFLRVAHNNKSENIIDEGPDANVLGLVEKRTYGHERGRHTRMTR